MYRISEESGSVSTAYSSRCCILLPIIFVSLLGFGWIWYEWFPPKSVAERRQRRQAAKQRYQELGGRVIERADEWTQIHLSRTPVEDADLLGLPSLSDTDELFLEQTAIGDLGMRSVGRLKHLRQLNLAETNVTDEGLAYLVELENLYDLNLSGTRIGDAGLQYIARLPRLRKLDLSHTLVTDQGLACLAHLQDLRQLNLVKANVRGTGLRKLVANENLRRLEVGGILLDDDAIEPLIELGQHLDSLWLRESGVSPMGLKQLKREMPNVRLWPNQLPSMPAEDPMQLELNQLASSVASSDAPDLSRKLNQHPLFDDTESTVWSSESWSDDIPKHKRQPWVAVHWNEKVLVKSIVIHELHDRFSDFTIQRLNPDRDEWIDTIHVFASRHISSYSYSSTGGETGWGHHPDRVWVDGIRLADQSGRVFGAGHDTKGTIEFRIILPRPALTHGIRFQVQRTQAPKIMLQRFQILGSKVD